MKESSKVFDFWQLKEKQKAKETLAFLRKLSFCSVLKTQGRRVASFKKCLRGVASFKKILLHSCRCDKKQNRFVLLLFAREQQRDSSVCTLRALFASRRVLLLFLKRRVSVCALFFLVFVIRDG